MLTLGYANGIWRPPLIKIGVKIMETDSVRCNWCEWYGEVERFSEVCPSCNRSGFLADIEGENNV